MNPSRDPFDMFLETVNAYRHSYLQRGDALRRSHASDPVDPHMRDKAESNELEIRCNYSISAGFLAR